MTADRQSLPHWDLSNVYPGLGSPEFAADAARLRGMLDELDSFLQERNGIGRMAGPPGDASALAPVMDELISRLGTALRHCSRPWAPIVSGFVTTDSYNQEAARKLSELEQLEVRLRRGLTRFIAYAGSLSGVLDVDLPSAAPWRPITVSSSRTPPARRASSCRRRWRTWPAICSCRAAARCGSCRGR